MFLPDTIVSEILKISQQSRVVEIASTTLLISQEVMAAASQIPDAQEGMRAFLEKRKPNFAQPRN